MSTLHNRLDLALTAAVTYGVQLWRGRLIQYSQQGNPVAMPRRSEGDEPSLKTQLRTSNQTVTNTQLLSQKLLGIIDVREI